jgi:hypothetical protein
MFALTTIRKMVSCALFVCLATSLEAEELSGATPPKSKADLDPQALRRFENLQAQLRIAQQELAEAKKRAEAENPLLSDAARLIDRSHRLGEKIAKEYPAVEHYLATLSSDKKKQYEAWNGASMYVYGYDVAKEERDDPGQRPIVVWFANLAIHDAIEKRPPAVTDLLRDTLPPKGTSISPERALDIFLLLAERKKDRHLARFRELDRELAPPSVLREYTKDCLVSKGQFTIADLYLHSMTPGYVTTAEKKVFDLSVALGRIWPGWGESPHKVRTKAEKLDWWRKRQRGVPADSR